MLFWIFVILIVIGCVAIYVMDKYYADLDLLIITSLIIGIIGIGMSLVFMIANHANITGRLRANQARYDSLIYQLENDVYDNDNDLGKKDLYEEIQDWNENLAWYQEAQNDFWIGIYIPDIYDNFEFIELE